MAKKTAKSVKSQKILPREPISDEIKQKSLEKSFKSEETPEKVAKKLRKQPTKKRMTPKQLANLRQYSDKEVSPESKAASVDNLSSQKEIEVSWDEIIFPETVHNPELLRHILTKDEAIYFIDRWNEYYLQYGQDLNESSDYDDLFELIICYVDLYRVQKRKRNNTALQSDVGIDKIQHNMHIRIQNLKSALKARRKDRLDNADKDHDSLLSVLSKRASDLDKFRESGEALLTSESDEEADAIRAKLAREGKGET